MKALHDSHRLLAALGREPAPAPADATDRSEAAEFLVRLGYLQRAPDGALLPPPGPDRTALGNRLALLRLAARHDRFFWLPNRHAPGLRFCGGEITTAAFAPPLPPGGLAGGRWPGRHGAGRLLKLCRRGRRISGVPVLG